MKKILLSLIVALIVIGATTFLVRFLPSERIAEEALTIPSATPPTDWIPTNLVDAWSATASISLPPGSSLLEGKVNEWMLPEAYLGKSRGMKTSHLVPSSPYDERGCLISSDLERIESQKEQVIDHVLFCVQEGTSVGAGQVYRTLLYSSKDPAVPLAIFFTIHYANSVQVFAGCETAEDMTKPDCAAREFNDDDMKIFTNMIGSMNIVKA